MSRIYLLKSGKRRLLSGLDGSPIEIHELDNIQFEIECLDSSPEIYIEDYKVSLKKMANFLYLKNINFLERASVKVLSGYILMGKVVNF